MSKLESLGKFLILTERCSPEVVVEVLRLLDGLGAKWGGRTSVYSEEEIVGSMLNRRFSVNVTVKASGIELYFSRERDSTGKIQSTVKVISSVLNTSYF